MKSDYYIDEAKKHLAEIRRILNMSASDYLDEVLMNHPEDKGMFNINDMWAYRTGVVQNEVERVLQILENREKSDAR